MNAIPFPTGSTRRRLQFQPFPFSLRSAALSAAFRHKQIEDGGSLFKLSNLSLEPDFRVEFQRLPEFD
jgi:hypothetical protein